MKTDRNMPTTNDIVERLVALKYREFEARAVAKKLDAMSSDLQAAFAIWWDTNTFTDSPVYSGYTVEQLMQTGKFDSPQSAFIFLDWLRRDPTEAKRALTLPHYVSVVREH